MSSAIHKTRPILVWADVDEGIADFVELLNTLPGVRTKTSCQGTLTEGGPDPYPPYVMVTWEDDVAKERLLMVSHLVEIDEPPFGGNNWGFVTPR